MTSTTEKVDIKAVRWLLTQLSQDFVQKNVLINEDKYNFTYIKKILQNYDKTNGINKVTYSKKDKYNILRDYGNGVQALPHTFRGLICKSMTDVDMKNAHPVIIYNLCKIHNITCLYLEQYVKDRNELISNGSCSKMDIIRSINKKKLLKCDGWLKSFDLEMKQIQKHMFEIPDFEKQKLLSETNPKNREGAFMSHLATSYEVQMLHHVIENVNVDIGVLMFDGFMFYGEKPDGFLELLSSIVKQKMNMDIEWAYKEHDNSLSVPSDFIEDNEDIMYNELKTKYENDYKLAFIENTIMYSLKINNNVIFYNLNELTQYFANVLVKKKPFINMWLTDPQRQTYFNVGVYPHDVICPDGILNMWDGYLVEKIPFVDVDITPMLNHLKIITKEEVVYEFLLDWLANMFQFPSSRSVMVIIQGEEGSGKSVLCDFITNIFGKDTSIEINDVKENLFGRFNSQLSKKVFANINETDRREMSPYFEKIKSLITSPTITIEEKGKKKYVEQSLLHILSTINGDNTFKITENSRRFAYIESSNKLVGDTEYFNELFMFIEKKTNQRAFYEFLMNRPVNRCLTVKDIPITDDMRKQFELNRDPIEDFSIEFFGERSAGENYNSYKAYIKSQGLQFEITKKLFEMRFTKYMIKYDIQKKRVMYDGAKQTVFYKLLIEG
tara:strand:+ start:480 stop:2483 length:2004 start_codon:yes stop_codon:yes gene_type:complete